MQASAVVPLEDRSTGIIMNRCFVLMPVLAGFSACAPAALPPALTAPANPHLQTRAPRYAPVTADVKRFDVVEPKDWRELNRAVGPRSGQPSTEGAERGR